MSPRYVLERTLPDGQVKTQGPTTRREACGLAAYVLTDNSVTSKQVALAVARRLDDAPDGLPVEGYGGYSFRLIRESAA
jgi:hypothetical protein